MPRGFFLSMVILSRRIARIRTDKNCKLYSTARFTEIKFEDNGIYSKYSTAQEMESGGLAGESKKSVEQKNKS